MAGVHALMLLIGLLVTTCEKSFQAGGWTEIREPDTHWGRAMAEYAYRSKNRHIRGSIIVFITQARHRAMAGTQYQFGFIVFIDGMMKEKCITTLSVPPIGTPGRKATVTRLWCR
ncbi:uncharacterized protein LOC119164414 [Rhipicephalus microplus]|uniref:uncharacterized protein LOC119164414 n=1 Tax=Rhipicephalus microplus TaxID=6941 RepID=UPI003F6CD12B